MAAGTLGRRALRNNATRMTDSTATAGGHKRKIEAPRANSLWRENGPCRGLPGVNSHQRRGRMNAYVPRKTKQDQHIAGP